MTRSDFEYIKDAFSQIIDDIAGNPDWHDATRAVASDIGTLEKLLEKRVVELSKDLEEAAEEYADGIIQREDALMCKQAFITGYNLCKEQIMKCTNNPDMGIKRKKRNERRSIQGICAGKDVEKHE